jgi:ubiquinone/menaquinone biosynthesis C-methylase UbiE
LAISLKEQTKKEMVLARKTYRWFYDHIHSRYYNLLVKWCFLPFGGEANCRERLIQSVVFSPAESILDLGCGTGGATHSISMKAGNGSQVIGMDLSLGQLRVAQKHHRPGRVHFVVGDAACPPFRECSFDKVFITHTLHEMPRKIRQNALAEARRILRDRGAIVVLELDNPRRRTVRWFIGLWFFYWLPFNFETPTRRDMLKRGLTREVEEAGFKSITKVSKCGGVFQIVQGVK